MSTAKENMSDTPREVVLVVEDDVKVLLSLRATFARTDYEIKFETQSEQAPAHIQRCQPRLVIVDAQLNRRDRLDICRQIRDDFAGAILLLSDKTGEDDEITALQAGADGYLRKPVNERLLLAHTHALMRRSMRDADAPETNRRGTVVLGDLHIDAVTRCVYLHSRPLVLTRGEFDLLWELARHPGLVRSRDDLYRCLFQRDWSREDRALDLRIARLRRRLEDNARQPRWIRSARGSGYYLAAPANQ